MGTPRAQAGPLACVYIQSQMAFEVLNRFFAYRGWRRAENLVQQQVGAQTPPSWERYLFYLHKKHYLGLGGLVLQTHLWGPLT